jgi:site-specific DNA-cytosine methylase
MVRNILSIFDGISCARLALDKIGFKYDNYYASEIDKWSLEIAKKNYPDNLNLGDITQIDGEKLSNIELLIGGSPCQGFSLIGEQLNFEDERSALIFHFFRLLEECKPKYFILENVKMKPECRDFISKKLGVEPIEINSSLVSGQNRRRLYWTNIPNIIQPQDLDIDGKTIFEDSKYEMATVRKAKGDLPRRVVPPNGKKLGCLTASYYKGANGDGRPAKATIFGEYSQSDLTMLTPKECERLQTIPDNYTEGISKTQRYKMIGNGFTVDVIAHILKNMEG